MIYYYKNHQLYDVKDITGLNYNGHHIEAKYRAVAGIGHPDPTAIIEKRGLFYLKDLQTIPKEAPYDKTPHDTNG